MTKVDDAKRGAGKAAARDADAGSPAARDADSPQTASAGKATARGADAAKPAVPPSDSPPSPAADSDGAGKRLREIVRIVARHKLARGVTPEKLRLLLEDLGPTFVKFGQIMSMREDMLPPAYCAELAKLRADVRPLPASVIRAEIEAELGKPLDAVFSSFEDTPIGAASIAQVHAATLRGGGRVVVKVQRPHIFETMERDIALLRKAAGVAKYSELGGVVDLRMVLDEMWKIAQEEMDFRREADSMRRFAADMAPLAYACCPQVSDAHCTRRVLVMEYIEGIAIDDAARLKSGGYDSAEIAGKLAECYVRQIVDTGFFHADPHPGNLRVRGGKIVWMDMGMMGTLTDRDRGLMRASVQAVAAGDSEKLKDIVLQIGVYSGRIDQTRLRQDIEAFLARYGEMDLGSMDLGQILRELTDLAHGYGISMPEGMTMLARGVMTIEGVLTALDPKTNVLSIMARHMSGQMLRDFDAAKLMKHYAKSLYASASKSLDLPAQISDALYLFNRGQAQLRVEAADDARREKARAEALTRLILALLACALLLGGALVLAMAGRGAPTLTGGLLLGAGAALGGYAALCGRVRRRGR